MLNFAPAFSQGQEIKMQLVQFSTDEQLTHIGELS